MSKSTNNPTIDSIRDPLENYKDVMDDYLGITKDLGIDNDDAGKDTPAVITAPEPNPGKRGPGRPRKSDREVSSGRESSAFASIRVSMDLYEDLKLLQMAYLRVKKVKMPMSELLKMLISSGMHSLDDDVSKMYHRLK